MTINDILNLNKLHLRHNDKYVIILKTPYMCFTLGETRYHAWICGELDLLSYTYTCKCLEEPVKDFKIENKCDFKLLKIWIDNAELQDEIYYMQDCEYNRRLNYEKKNTETI